MIAYTWITKKMIFQSSNTDINATFNTKEIYNTII